MIFTKSKKLLNWIKTRKRIIDIVEILTFGIVFYIIATLFYFIGKDKAYKECNDTYIIENYKKASYEYKKLYEIEKSKQNLKKVIIIPSNWKEIKIIERYD